MGGSLLTQLVDVQPEVALFAEAPKTEPARHALACVGRCTIFCVLRPLKDSRHRSRPRPQHHNRLGEAGDARAVGTPDTRLTTPHPRLPTSSGGRQLSHKQRVWPSLPKGGSAGRLHVTSLDVYRHANNVERGGSGSSLAKQVHLNG